MKKSSKIKISLIFILILIVTAFLLNRFLISLELDMFERKMAVMGYVIINIAAFILLIALESSICKRERIDLKKPVNYRLLSDNNLKAFLKHLLRNATGNLEFFRKVSKMLYYQNHISTQTKIRKDNRTEVKATIFNRKGKMVKVKVVKDFFDKY